MEMLDEVVEVHLSYLISSFQKSLKLEDHNALVSFGKPHETCVHHDALIQGMMDLQGFKESVNKKIIHRQTQADN